MKRPFIFLYIALLLFTACSSQATPGTVPTPASTPTPILPTATFTRTAAPPTITPTITLIADPLIAQLVGKFKMTITSDEAKANPVASLDPGDYTLNFVGDMTWYVIYVGFRVLKGNFEVSSETISFTTTGGGSLGNCPEDWKGIYTWTLNDNELTFTAVDDTCAQPNYFFQIHPFIRQ